MTFHYRYLSNRCYWNTADFGVNLQVIHASSILCAHRRGSFDKLLEEAPVHEFQKKISDLYFLFNSYIQSLIHRNEYLVKLTNTS